MRVVVAPDSFGGTLTAVQAARAIADGWTRGRPGDQMVLLPRSDGGPGFVDVLATAGGQVREALVAGPLQTAVPARWLLDSGTAYLEAAQVCGLHLLGGPPTRETALAAHSRGVGDLMRVALAAGAREIVIGLGGTCCTDGGRGMIGALGGLDEAAAVLRDSSVIAATDVENVLLGGEGAAAVFGPQKGAQSETVAVLEERNARWAGHLCAHAGRSVAEVPGAGAAGGIAAALFALGAARRSGADVVAERTHQDGVLAAADLVITGEGRFDAQSLRGKLVVSLAARAAEHGVPTLVLAGQVDLAAREVESVSIVAARSMTDFAGSIERAVNDAFLCLRDLAEHTAGEWSVAAARCR